jgi:hypothetical protein
MSDKIAAMSELPVVCTPGPYALGARRQELPDVFRLRFAPSGETLSSIAR